ncbi:MAG: hypothetical protein JXO49_00640 [Deltaproteobacteria bacterium]|nr:hypothetical protein [Candidatus Anaeroferrophillus wilburensis]MBN2887832.1 hypothetical protein [Deltaproteobacteria bacterium]
MISFFLRQLKFFLFLALCSLFMAGCAQDIRSFKDTNTEISLVQRIAVLPFENHTKTQLVENRLRDIVTTEILSSGLFAVVAGGDVQRFLDEEVGKQTTILTSSMAKRLGRELGVSAYLVGAVDMYEEKRNGSYSYPVVAMTLQLIEVQSGNIIWQASGSESGYTTGSRIFGFASDDFNRVSFALAQKLLQTMY